MAGTKISELTSASALVDTDKMPVVNSATTKATTLALLRSQLSAASVQTVAYATTVTLDFSGAPSNVRDIALTGNLTLVTTGLASGRSITARLVADGSTRTLTLPAWVPVGSALPTSLAAGKTAILTVTSFGTTNAECVAAYAVQP
jgi:hypothetical protein